MSGYLLGWGAKSDWEEYPRDTPLSPDHSGSLVDYGGSWYYGVAPDGEVPEGTEVELLHTFYPVDGGAARTASKKSASSYSNPVDYFRESYWDPAPAGVYEVELYINGVRGPNKLVMVALEAEVGYATISYYAEANGAPSAFWTAIKGARENP